MYASLETRTFYICPSVNPDSAELALADKPKFIRFSTRPYAPDEEGNDGLVIEDIDGDGQVLGVAGYGMKTIVHCVESPCRDGKFYISTSKFIPRFSNTQFLIAIADLRSNIIKFTITDNYLKSESFLLKSGH